MLEKLLEKIKTLTQNIIDFFVHKVDKDIYLKTIILIIVPLLIYIYCQLFSDGKFIFEKKRMYLNFFFVYAIIGLFYVITGKIKLSLYISLGVTFVVGIINHFITAFRGTPLVPWDIFSVNVALTVLPTFTFSISFKLLLGIIAFGLALYILKSSHFSSFKNNKFKITYRILVLLGIVLFTYSFYFTNLIDKFELDDNWDPKEEYHNNGLIASLFKQSRNLIITVPKGYDINSINDLASSIDVKILEPPEDFERPNIITIMNESFAELQTVGKFSTNKEYLPFFNSLSDNTIKGNLHVSIFGATTPNSEWEFLTSNTMAFVPRRTVPYQQYVLRRSYSLATILKEHNYNTNAIHCYYPQGYNRNLAYPRLGFNSFYSIHNLRDLEYIREYPSDLSTYQNIIDIYKSKNENEKLFNFTLTMQNHGSYTDENFENTIIAGTGIYPKLNQYLSLIKLSDDALKYLINYFSEQDEHTIILIFGDHQPYVEDAFYDTLLSKKFTDITSKEATEKKYITPFIIWANYDIDEKKYSNITDISANYLASLLLDVAQIQKTPYLEFLDELRKEIPIITGNGYVDKNEIYHDFSEETPYSKLLENYNYLQFNNMFDNNNKITSLFEVPESNQELIDENIDELENIVETEVLENIDNLE